MLQRVDQAETGLRPLRLAAIRSAAGAPYLLLFVALWGLGRTYHGIVGDAILYIGRGLADIDPAGVGRDLMFTDDGQSQFSLFTLVARGLVGCLGPGRASLILALGGQVLWVAASACFVFKALGARPRVAFAALICLAVLPSFYGPFQRLHFAEAVAIPRPYAEAIVLLALAALLARRDALATGLMVLAGLLHPIMALAGLGTLLIVKAQEERRWLVVTLALAAALAGAGWLGLPLANRVFVPLDPAWRAVLLARAPMLFPSQWDMADYAALTVQAVTLAVAASLAEGRLRAIVAGALVVGLGGLAVSALFGDRLSLILIVQAQPWRALWLPAALAAVSFAQCGTAPGAAASRLVFVFLALGWFFMDQPLVAEMSAAAAAGLHVVAARGRLRVSPATVRSAALAVAALVVFADVRQIVAHLQVAASGRPAAGNGFVDLCDIGVLPLPIALAAIWWARRETLRPRPVVAFLLGFGLLAVASGVWDDRAAMQKRVEENGPPADLASIVAAHQGSVVWIDGIDETTFWLRRPNWYSTLQGTGAVFSRPLALEWDRRKSVLIALGLLPKGDRDLPGDVTTRPLPSVTAAQVEALCRRAATLAWIVIPILATERDPQGLTIVDWTPPVPLFRVGFEESVPHWTKIEHYALAACAAAGAP